MALLTLKDIGKIYVSEGNVAIGIRGINLSFDKGEFVAVTGKSGSGKSTLLNVISGMDTYEEGELFIEGQPTSHYLQPDWEDYRQKYISFIFQDYNIIESYTVLQNVELALMHIRDRKERRRRAIELITRVGMKDHMRQKGSRLSGGQKQRTVIARALAKDSPIILADEPTGNLDSATSEEIINLLREVSRDKLLIVVTHNFEQVEHCATRHVRIFDGAVESDHVLEAPLPTDTPVPDAAPQDSARKIKQRDIANGITLGRTMFTSRPKLSIFMCLLMIIGGLAIFLITALCGEAGELFEPSYMFSHIEGRVVLTHQDGSPIPEEELKTLAEKYGADEYLHYDVLLDNTQWFGFSRIGYYEAFRFSYRPDSRYAGSTGLIGHEPTERGEVLLYLPLYYQQYFGDETVPDDTLMIFDTEYRVSGVRYYYDSNLDPLIVMTEQGFRDATTLHYLNGNSLSAAIQSDLGKGFATADFSLACYPSIHMESGKIYIDSNALPLFEKQTKSSLKEIAGSDSSTESDKEFANGLLAEDFCHTITVNGTWYDYSYGYFGDVKQKEFSGVFDDAEITETPPTVLYRYASGIDTAYVGIDLLNEIADATLAGSYRQASLFFSSDAEARRAADRITEDGYIAVSSDTTYREDALEAILTSILSIVMAIAWIISVVFLAFFIYLCSARTLSTFKGDMAIMRSMGIPVKVIRIGMYVRMLISLIPAYVLILVAAVLIYVNPVVSAYFTYLYPWQYALIFLGLLILTYRVTRKQIRKLFGESVKKALKGGSAE